MCKNTQAEKRKGVLGGVRKERKIKIVRKVHAERREYTMDRNRRETRDKERKGKGREEHKAEEKKERESSVDSSGTTVNTYTSVCTHRHGYMLKQSDKREGSIKKRKQNATRTEKAVARPHRYQWEKEMPSFG